MKRKSLSVLLIILMFILVGCGKENVDKKAFERGAWNENVYTNGFANLKIEVPKEWTIATDEEIATIMDLGVDALTGQEKIAGKIAKMKTVYDAMAQNIYTGNNVIIMFENLSLSIGGTSLDEKGYLDIVKTQIGSESQENRVTGEVYEVKVGEVTYYALPTELTDLGIKQVYYAKKVDNYMACILTTATDDEDLKSFIK